MLCAHTVRRLKPGTFDQFRVYEVAESLALDSAS